MSRSGYYAWLVRPESERTKEDRRLLLHVRAAHARSGGTYGVRRVHAELADEGVAIGRERVARLMRGDGIEARPRKRRRKATPVPAAPLDLPNLLSRNFGVERPNEAWVADMTEFATGEGTLYLAAIVDLYARRVVGWSVSSSMHRSLVLTALERALTSRGNVAGVIHHSDQGSVYTSEEYRAALDVRGVRASYSGRGQCLDNAPMESFFSTVKHELISRRHFLTHGQARQALGRYIELFYNHRRRHSALGYKTPAAYEAAHASAST